MYRPSSGSEDGVGAPCAAVGNPALEGFMENRYADVVACALFVLLAASFIIPAIRLLRRIRSNGVSRDTHHSLAMNFAVAVVVCVALTTYMLTHYVGDQVFYWRVSGLVALMLTHLETLRLFLKDHVETEAVE
jgi:hypothetical protein